VGEYSTHASNSIWTQGVGIYRSFISCCETPLMGKLRKRAEIPAIPKNSAELAANFEDSRNQRGLYFPRRAHRTTTICSHKPPRFPVKAETNVCRIELRWTDQRGVAAPDGAGPALRVRQQRYVAFAPSLRSHNNVIDAEVWRETAWVKLLVQGRRDRLSPRKSMFMPCYTLCASTPCDSVGWA
jgi:hypothetical protein